MCSAASRSSIGLLRRMAVSERSQNRSRPLLGFYMGERPFTSSVSSNKTSKGRPLSKATNLRYY